MGPKPSPRVDDGDAVDRDPGGERLVSRFGYGATGIVVTVPGNVEDALVALRGRDGKPFHRVIDPAADRGTTSKRSRCSEDGRGDQARCLLVAQDGPIHDHFLLALSRPFDERNGDSAVTSAKDRMQNS